MTTTLAAAVAAFTWGAVEGIAKGKVSVLGLCSGAVAGLVVITPAAGFVTAQSAVIMGVLAGVVPYIACTKIKSIIKSGMPEQPQGCSGIFHFPRKTHGFHCGGRLA